MSSTAIESVAPVAPAAAVAPAVRTTARAPIYRTYTIKVLASIPEYRAIPPPFYRALQSNLRRRRHIIRTPHYGPSRRGQGNHRLVLVYRLAGPELRENGRIRGCPHREEILATRRRRVFQGYQRVSMNTHKNA